MSFWVLHLKPCVLRDFSLLDFRNVSYFQCYLGSGNYSSYSFALALSPALESLPTHTCSSVICWTLEGRFLESPLHRSLLCNTPLWKPWTLWLLQTSTCISSAQRPPGSASAAPPCATSWKLDSGIPLCFPFLRNLAPSVVQCLKTIVSYILSGFLAVECGRINPFSVALSWPEAKVSHQFMKWFSLIQIDIAFHSLKYLFCLFALTTTRRLQ